MSNEPGSRECRNLIDAKESLIEAMQSLSGIKNTDHIHRELKKIYNELEEIHDSRRMIENVSS